MTDRELLELAAKSAGWTGWQSKHGYWNIESPEGEKSTHCHSWTSYDPYTGERLQEPTFGDAIADANWNPLTDDGDALRLAVKLGLQVFQTKYYVRCGRKTIEMPIEESKRDQDHYAATRRAIVRAAAEIGKDMK